MALAVALLLTAAAPALGGHRAPVARTYAVLIWGNTSDMPLGERLAEASIHDCWRFTRGGYLISKWFNGKGTYTVSWMDGMAVWSGEIRYNQWPEWRVRMWIKMATAELDFFGSSIAGTVVAKASEPGEVGWVNGSFIGFNDRGGYCASGPHD